jgi:protein-export SecD/SecF family membrane protein
VGKSVIFILVIIIAALSYLAVFGVKYQAGDTTKSVIKGAQDIRFGIDIKGGVDVVFTPPAGTKVTKEQMQGAVERINQRLDGLKIADREVFPDYTSNRIEVRFPWQSGTTTQDPEKAIKELGSMSQLTFKDESGNVLLTGSDVSSSSVELDNETSGYAVALTFSSEGTKKFSDATTKNLNKTISIYMDDDLISSPTVNSAITDGKAIINTPSTGMTKDEASSLSTKINAGSLPFKLVTENYNTISATLGANALHVTVLAGLIAFLLVCIFMILYYRLPGFIACIALCGHLAGTLLCISIPQFTLTLPGIAGIILSIGMGVDCNIITAERIKEELRVGKTLDGAIDAGFHCSFSAIFDGNITVVIVGILLWILGSGTVQSFGYTLIIGVIFNFIMGLAFSRLMLKSISKFSGVRKNWLFGGALK